jgi:benzoate 4-monooxygenase
MEQESEDPAKIPPVSEALFGSCVAGQMPWAADAFAYLRDRLPIPQVQEVLAALDIMIPIAVKNIRLRAEKKLDREDILGKLIAAREEKTGQALTEEQIVAESVTLIVGGTHTTGNTLHILLANLSRNSDYLRRVIEEIDKKLPPLKSDQAAYSMNGLEEKLDFVLAAIRESHRKDPVGTFNMPRAVPDGGARIAGSYIPARVSLTVVTPV